MWEAALPLSPISMLISNQANIAFKYLFIFSRVVVDMIVVVLYRRHSIHIEPKVVPVFKVIYWHLLLLLSCYANVGLIRKVRSPLPSMRICDSCLLMNRYSSRSLSKIYMDMKINVHLSLSPLAPPSLNDTLTTCAVRCSSYFYETLLFLCRLHLLHPSISTSELAVGEEEVSLWFQATLVRDSE